MKDPKIGVTLTGGQIQGVAGAGNVVIENFTIYNNPAHDAGNAASGDGPIPRCPYQGLAYFGPGDEELFFGRDAAVTRLAEAVGRQSLTALVGASGSGKSSVVLAGLAPRLHRAGDWRFSHFRIGAELDRNCFLALARALVPLYVDSTSATERLKNTKQLATSIETGELSLRDVFADCRSRNKGRHILLIADQFEEAFSLLQDETVRHRFIDVLLAGFRDVACDGSPEVHLILTLRGDFYGQALGYGPFAHALQGHVENLTPMSREELQAAIVYPAENENVSFEPGLVETLLDNVGIKPGNLPLLQFALREVWGRQEKGKITRKSYDDIGGVQGALAHRAETVFAVLTEDSTNPEMNNAFRRLFTRLVTLGEGEEDTRRVVERQELSNGIWSLAQRLADENNRLVVTNTKTLGRETVEVTHEALIRHWPRLVDWINRDRAFQLWLRQIRPHVDLWLADRADEGPLLRGSALEQAQEWLATRNDDLSTPEQSFIKASLVLREQLRAERILLNDLMRSLQLSDLTDQEEVDLARMNKLRGFLDLMPTAGFPAWKEAVALYGEALGLDGTTVSKIVERRLLVHSSQTTDTSVELEGVSTRRLAVIASAGAQHVALLDPGTQGPVFGRYFNEALEGGAADSNGVVTVGSAFDYVRRTLETEYDQFPIMRMPGDMQHFPLTSRNGSSLEGGGKRRALLVAASDYRDAGLPGVEATLGQTAYLLRDQGRFEVSLLIGTEARRDNLAESLVRLGLETGPDDCVLFYFSGHAGFNDRDPRSFSLYLVGSDDPDDRVTMLGIEELRSWIVNKGGGAAIVILDTCFSGSAIEGFL